MSQGLSVWLAVAAQLVLAATFLWAALSKALSVAQLATTLHSLGLAPPLTMPAAWAVTGSELIAALGLVVVPIWWWPRALVVLFAFAFASAGIVAVVAKRRIVCHCFGNVSAGNLGWRQVALLPGWLVLAAVAQWHPPHWSVQQGLTVLAFLLFGLAVVRLPAVLRPMRRLAADRVAMAPTYQSAITAQRRENQP